MFYKKKYYQKKLLDNLLFIRLSQMNLHDSYQYDDKLFKIRQIMSNQMQYLCSIYI